MAHEHHEFEPPIAGEHEQSHHAANYLMVLGVLLVFTLLSVVFDVVDMKGKTVLGVFNGSLLLIVLVLAVAAAKALCVMAYFMHLKFERNWKYVLLAPTIILAMGLPLALMPDIGVPYYTSVAPQREEVVHERAKEESEAAETRIREPVPPGSHE
ncbi:MAG: cytochrome C oxidase subunit IV family protein [Planctomycetes bacterium]|nr:cytochrome C oxidase subunit IV family protein [Planctomycetota bacterium]